jgi:DNA-binding transcriptional MerR regulator
MVAIMSEKELKIGDIAHLTGLTEQDVRRLIQTYESLFTYRTIGPVRLFPQRAVKIVRELAELSGKGLSPDEITERLKSGKRPAAPEEEAAEEAEPAAAPLPAEVVIDLGVMRDTLALQERRIARLSEELDRERQERASETAQLRRTIDDLEERLSEQKRHLALVAEWVDYFDRQVDEITRPLLERLRRRVTKKSDPGQSVNRSG